MTDVAVIVFEHRSRWTPQLQHQFQPHEARIRGCRSIGQVERLLMESVEECDCTDSGTQVEWSAHDPAGTNSDSGTGGKRPAIVLDLQTGVADCLQLLERLARDARHANTILLGSPELAELEWIARELGAVEFVVDILTPEDLARLCRRVVSIP